MIHILYLTDKTDVFIHSLVILYEIFFEIHNVFIWCLFGTEDVDMTKITILAGLDEG